MVTNGKTEANEAPITDILIQPSINLRDGMLAEIDREIERLQKWRSEVSEWCENVISGARLVAFDYLEKHTKLGEAQSKFGEVKAIITKAKPAEPTESGPHVESDQPSE